MNIELNANNIYNILKSKGITHFHHANTVATSKSFIDKEALLSRKKIETLDLEQTPQDSDTIDKKFEIYDYIFLDGLDLAEYFSQPNVYGPVLFKFKIEILLSITTIRITKLNPLYWNENLSIDAMYFTSCEEFDNKYKIGNKLRDGNSCFVITTMNGILPFSNSLTEILIDDPKSKTSNGIEILEIIKNYLFENLQEFKQKYPEVNLKKTTRFAHIYKHFTKSKFLKHFKRTFRN